MPCSCDRRGMWDRRVSIGQTLNENSGMSTLEPLMELRIKQCTGKYNHSIGNMRNEVDIENLTIEQYLMLTQENETQGMIRTESSRIITKNIDDMAIAEYIEYEAEMIRGPWRYTRNSGLSTLGGTKSLENMHQPDKLKTNDYFPSIPTYEWLNEELSKCKTGQDKEEEEDALIDILKTVGVSFIAEEEEWDRAGINMMPKSLFEHLKLANLKKTSMVIEMVIDTLEEPDETILLGRPFLATTHAQIDVFRGEILLGVGNEKVKFDMNGEICHSGVPLEKIYMANSIQESEYFNPHEMENDDSPALEQRTFHYSEESVDTVDSSSDSQENEVGNHIFENESRWHVCKPVHITFKVCEEDCGIWPTCNPDLSFCSGYEAIYGK
ncbi:hypothetical protein Tco_0646799 [Tanacetum coccineum]